MELRKAESLQERLEFIYFPARLYRNNSCWVPPLWSDEKKELLKGKNSVLKRSDHALFSVYSDGEIVGRIIVYIDPNYNNYHKSRTGHFGAFEAVDDGEVFRLLFSGAESWLKEREMNTFLGPINPLAECWGFLIDGFDTPPVFMSPYNPPWYDERIREQGFSKVKDLLAYEAADDEGYILPERFTEFRDKYLKRHPRYSFRSIDPKNLIRDARHILNILNRGVGDNWGYVPVEEDEMIDVVAKLKPIMDPGAIIFVEDEGKPVGCCLGFPDLNRVIKPIDGKLFPFGFIRLLTGIRKVKDYRLWGLAMLPEYIGKGLDVILYTRLYDYLKPRGGVRLEANWILEDNYRMRNPIEKMGLTPIKKYRVYKKNI